jgi:hypothetical protein
MSVIRKKFPNFTTYFQENGRKLDNGPEMQFTKVLDNNELNIQFIGVDKSGEKPSFTMEEFLKLFSDLSGSFINLTQPSLPQKVLLIHSGSFM